MKDRFELIIFDWDGTLCNSIDGIVNCIQQAAINQQIEPPSIRQSRDVIGLSLDRAMMQLFPHLTGNGVNALVDEYRGLYLSRPQGVDPLFSGVSELLANLKRAGYRLAIATGKSRRGLEHVLSGADLEGCFELACCGDEVSSKPSPDMLYELLNSGGVKADRALMVGDSALDLEMAKNAGIASVAVSSGVHSRERLMPFEPLICIDEVRELAASLL